MDCPYYDCNSENIQKNDKYCPDCKRRIKFCNSSNCSSANRVFAVYCRECGEKIPDRETNWMMFKGGTHRTGISRFDTGINNIGELNSLNENEIFSFDMSGYCKSILIYENYVFTFSHKGEIYIVDISQEPSPIIFNAGGEIFSEPAICDGSLYVGTRNSIQAYTLDKLVSKNSTYEPRWNMPVNGIPIKALFPFGDRLYYTLMIDKKHHEIYAIKNLSKERPDSSECINKGPYLSSIAGIYAPKNKKAYYLSGTTNLKLNIIDHTNNINSPEYSSIKIQKAPSKFEEHVPIAVLGSKIFAVFKEKEYLCRIDSKNGEVERNIVQSAKEFALAGLNDPIVVTSAGLYFKKFDHQINLSREERKTIKGSPVILKNHAIAVGMQGGAVRFYDIHNKGFPIEWDISSGYDDFITSIASSRNIIAAGNQKGTVKISKIV